MAQNTPKVLEEIQSQIEKVLLNKGSLNEEDIEDYDAIKRIIDLKLNKQEIRDLFKVYQDYILDLASIDFSKRLSVDNGKDLFSYIGASLNFLADELEVRALPVEFLEKIMEKVMEAKPDFALLTTSEGKITYVAKNPHAIMGYSKEKLVKSRIQNFLAANIHFEATSGDFIKNQDVHIINSDSVLIPVKLTVEEITPINKKVSPYYLYMFKEKALKKR